MIGQPALVGERGPELFVPDQAGTIIPNEQMVGGIVIQNLNIMPGANIDAALTEKPMTYWVDLTQENLTSFKYFRASWQHNNSTN